MIKWFIRHKDPQTLIFRCDGVIWSVYLDGGPNIGWYTSSKIRRCGIWYTSVLDQISYGVITCATREQARDRFEAVRRNPLPFVAEIVLS